MRVKFRNNPALKPKSPVIYYYNTPRAFWLHILDQSEQVAGMKFYFYDQNVKISYAAAKEGFGPLLYETVASVMSMPLTPSADLSYEALHFWEKNNNVILPLNPSEYRAKWNFDLYIVLNDGSGLDLSELENNVVLYGGYKPVYSQLKFPKNELGFTVEQQVNIEERKQL